MGRKVKQRGFEPLKGLLVAALTGVCVMVAGVMPAAAVLMDGSYAISGGQLAWTDNNGNATTLNLATAVVFTPATNNFTVNSAIGDFAALLNQTGTIKPFVFTGPGGSVGAPPIASFEVIGGLTFDLTSISDVTTMCPSGCNATTIASILIVNGTGVFHMAGFEDTPGDFSFTGQQLSQSFSFSASQASTTTPVPEPATLLLLGTGLVALGVYARRRNRS